MRKSKLITKRALAWRVALTIGVLAAALYVLVTHWSVVSTSLHAAQRANAAWVGLSLACMACTFCIAAAMYGVLAMHRLRYRQTLLVEVAGALVNRILPAGLGGLGLNGVYLYKHKHTPAEATVVVSVNNVLGMCAHVLLLILLCVCQPTVVRTLLVGHHVVLPWGWIIVGLALICVICSLPIVRRKLASFTRHLLVSLRKIQAAKAARALLLAVLLTTAYTITLFSAARSVGITLGISQMFVVFSFGILVGTATPTPGGLVGAEAGLFAGLVLYGIPGVQAGAAVLLFRLVSYWLPLAPGAVALLVARNCELL
jgi:uncharacterized protein (TIRG00374 family)